MSQLPVLSEKRTGPNLRSGDGWTAHAQARLRLCAAASSALEANGDAHAFNRVALGHASADAMLHGGLALAAVHEVFAEGHQGAAATGFIAGLAGRVAPRKPLVWVRQDFAELESGALSMSGLCRARSRSAAASSPCAPPTSRPHCAPRRMRSPAMRSALSCWKSGAKTRQLDLVASRKLTLAAQASGVTALLLRVAAKPAPSTAETRWIVRAAHSPPAAAAEAWGAPVFDAQLVRNRHGPVGRWIMEWKCDECLFREPAAYPQPVAAAPAHRPHPAAMP